MATTTTTTYNTSEEDLLNDIQHLQAMEKKMFLQLQQTPLDAAARATIINKIANLTSLRTKLYQTLNKVHAFYKTTMDATLDAYQEQKQSVMLLERELNRSKQELAQLQDNKHQQLRLIEINHYYQDRYTEHTSLVKLVIVLLVLVGIMSWIHRLFPFRIVKAVLIILLLIGAYLFWAKYASIMTRNNMNYQTYDWAFQPPTDASATSTSASDADTNNPWATGTLACVGAACCTNGLTYDAENNICLIPKE